MPGYGEYNTGRGLLGRMWMNWMGRDIQGAKQGNPYAIARLGSQGAGIFGTAAKPIINWRERSHYAEDNPAFVGPPREGQAQNGPAYMPRGMAQDNQGYYYKDPSQVGPPAPDQPQQPNDPRQGNSMQVQNNGRYLPMFVDANPYGGYSSANGKGYGWSNTDNDVGKLDFFQQGPGIGGKIDLGSLAEAMAQRYMARQTK